MFLSVCQKKKYKYAHGDTKQEWFNKHLKNKALFILVWDLQIMGNKLSWNKDQFKLSVSENTVSFVSIFPWNRPAMTGWKA